MRPASVTEPTSVLVDDTTGIVTSVVRQPQRAGLPRAFRSSVAHVAAIGQVQRWHADPFAHGAALGSGDAAWWPAVGEAVERYCGNAVPRHRRIASADELEQESVPHVRPDALALYGERQYAASGFPFVPITPQSQIAWARTRRVTHPERGKAETLVPASAVYLNYYSHADPVEPRAHSPLYAGIAAGQDTASASLAATLEVVERDAVTIWWHSGSPAVGVDIAESAMLRQLSTTPEAAALRLHLIAIPHRTGLPVIGALAEDTDRTLVAFGTACRPHAGDAAVKAVTEALGLLQLAGDLADESSPLWSARAQGNIVHRDLQVFRADRRYLDSYGPHWHAMTDLTSNAQLYLDPRMQGARIDRLRPAPAIPLSEIDTHAPQVNSFDDAARLLELHGFNVYVADITTPNVALGGLRVVRVIVPGMYSNAPAAFPLLGGSRLYTEPARLGLSHRPLQDADLVLDPLPFT